jgi:hypothetical protein
MDGSHVLCQYWWNVVYLVLNKVYSPGHRLAANVFIAKRVCAWTLELVHGESTFAYLAWTFDSVEFVVNFNVGNGRPMKHGIGGNVQPFAMVHAFLNKHAEMSIVARIEA